MASNELSVPLRCAESCTTHSASIATNATQMHVLTRLKFMEIYDNLRAVSRAVAVSGIGIVSPFGSTHQSFVDNLLQGRSAVAPLTGFDTSQCGAILAAQTTTFQST